MIRRLLQQFAVFDAWHSASPSDHAGRQRSSVVGRGTALGARTDTIFAFFHASSRYNGGRPTPAAVARPLPSSSLPIRPIVGDCKHSWRHPIAGKMAAGFGPTGSQLWICSPRLPRHQNSALSIDGEVAPYMVLLRLTSYPC